MQLVYPWAVPLTRPRTPHFVLCVDWLTQVCMCIDTDEDTWIHMQINWLAQVCMYTCRYTDTDNLVGRGVHVYI